VLGFFPERPVQHPSQAVGWLQLPPPGRTWLLSCTSAAASRPQGTWGAAGFEPIQSPSLRQYLNVGWRDGHTKVWSFGHSISVVLHMAFIVYILVQFRGVLSVLSAVEEHEAVHSSWRTYVASWLRRFFVASLCFGLSSLWRSRLIGRTPHNKSLAARPAISQNAIKFLRFLYCEV